MMLQHGERMDARNEDPMQTQVRSSSASPGAAALLRRHHRCTSSAERTNLALLAKGLAK